MLKSLRISSGVFPLIMLATVLQPTSLEVARLLNENKIRNNNAQKRFDVQVVGRKNDLKKHFLIHSDELLVPFTDIGGAFACLVLTLFVR